MRDFVRGSFELPRLAYRRQLLLWAASFVLFSSCKEHAASPNPERPEQQTKDASDAGAGRADAASLAPELDASSELDAAAILSAIPLLDSLSPLPNEQTCFELSRMRTSGVDAAAPFISPRDVDGGVVGTDFGSDAGAAGSRHWAPELLSQTGCFQDTASLTVARGLFRYEINSPLWTDGAIKQRFVALPPGKQIEIEENGLWIFPIGSVLLKNFIIEFEASNFASQKPVETRVAVRAADRWHFYSYAWDDDAQDARLLAEDEWRKVPMRVKQKQGESTFDYLFPNELSCLVCHGNDERGVLGPRTDQLNRTLNYAGELINQLDALHGIGAFKNGLPKPALQLPAMPDPADESAAVQERARSYLAANCSHCHKPGGWVPTELDMDLRFDTPLAQANICNVPARYGSSFLEADRIRASDAEQSVIWQRMQDLGFSRMPMLGTSVLDPTANVIAEWINSLNDCPPRQ